MFAKVSFPSSIVAQGKLLLKVVLTSLRLVQELARPNPSHDCKSDDICDVHGGESRHGFHAQSWRSGGVTVSAACGTSCR
jgi:hypothetical protein